MRTHGNRVNSLQKPKVVAVVPQSQKMAEALCEQIAVLKEKYASIRASKECLIAKKLSGKENTSKQYTTGNLLQRSHTPLKDTAKRLQRRGSQANLPHKQLEVPIDKKRCKIEVPGYEMMKASLGPQTCKPNVSIKASDELLSCRNLRTKNNNPEGRKKALDSVNELFARLDKHNIKEIRADLEAVKKVVKEELDKMSSSRKCRIANHVRTKSANCFSKPVESVPEVKGTDFMSRLASRRKSGVVECHFKKLVDHIEDEHHISNSPKKQEGSTKGTTGQSSDPEVDLEYTKDKPLQDRDKLILRNFDYIKLHKSIPVTTVDQYKFVKLIGKGAFGKVALGIHKLTGKYVAIKTIDKSFMRDAASKKKVFREVYILKKIRHSSVIRLLEVFEGPMHLLIVMEYAAGGDLLRYIKKKKRLSEIEAKRIFKQIVHGLGHIHSRSVLHRDIKPDNILLDYDNRVKICDFGVSKIIDNVTLINEQCGTPAYIAPEIITGTGYKGYYADHWSLGVLLFTMLCGSVPFKSNSMKELHKLIKGRIFTYPAEISNEAKDLIERLIQVVPEKRLSIPEVLAHPWLHKESKYENYVDKDACVNIAQMPAIPGDINVVNLENLFYNENCQKIPYEDYCSIANDFYTQHLNESALKTLDKCGYPREIVIKDLERGELNHATAGYNLLIL